MSTDRFAGYSLRQLREWDDDDYMTQAALAKLLGVSQPRIAQLEAADPMTLRLSAIAAYVAALGGTLELDALFPGEHGQRVHVQIKLS